MEQRQGKARKIFICADNSKPAESAFKWYLDNVLRETDEVYVVHCAEYNYFFMPGAAADVEAITQMAKEKKDTIDLMMNDYMDQLRPRHVKAKTKVLSGEGKPGEAIIKAAEEEKPDMIIMGSRGLGTIRRTLLGSVSEYIIHHAPPHCTVTIMRDS